MRKTTVVTAREVRDFFRANEKRMSLLSPEAQATVAPGARGRLHPEAVDIHNRRRQVRQYVLGASRDDAARREAEREALRLAGVPVGKRGPMSKVARKALAQTKA